MMRFFTNKKISFLAVFFLCALGCSSPQRDPRHRYRESALLMGTTVQIDVCYTEGEEDKLQKAYQQVWARLEEVSARMSVFDPASEISRINESNGEPLEVPADIYELIQESIRLNKLTAGAFDITVGPLIELWRKSAQRDVYPGEEELKIARKSVGVAHIELLGQNRVRVSRGVKIDLGGIAKGYAVDEAARLLRGNNFTDFLIDAGGDLYISGRNREYQPWLIGIKHPRQVSQVIDRIRVKDAAITTSGDYERFLEI
ncbi:MAG: FAD:protein FMN transferase, partial [Candidatus Omnitrophota bacterium]